MAGILRLVFKPGIQQTLATTNYLIEFFAGLGITMRKKRCPVM